MTGYPWKQGDELLAQDLNAAIANAGNSTQLIGRAGPLFVDAADDAAAAALGVEPGGFYRNGSAVMQRVA